ncbi:MAG: hypothetical protein H7835_08405, partial [Magnetococcus sp. XQGC-1]
MLRHTKTQQPQFDHALLRTRLFALLDDHAGPCWLAGPAGSGKTVLAATWVTARQHPCLWYHITPEDTDPAAFFLHFSHGAAALPGRGELPALTPADMPTLQDFSLRYFRKFRSRLKAPATLVLDNLHDLPAQSPLLGVLREVLLPQSDLQLRVLLISREEPTASCAHLLADGSLRVINGMDLRLNLEECRDLVRLRNPAFGEREATSLHWRTDGWVAGVPLLLGQADLEEETTARIDDGGTEAVFDYFGRKVFDALPPEQQTFLLQVAHLPEMTGIMASGLTGLADAGRLLAQWERKQFFIAREGDGSRNTRYRFHDLFRAFLLASAHREWSGELLNQVRGQAATILVEAGKIEAAAHLYRTMEEWPALTRLLLAQAPDLLAHSRFSTLATWLSWFPESLLREDPWLSLWQGTALTFVQPEQAAPWFATALNHFATHGPLEAAWNAWCGRLECAQLLHKGLEDPTAWRQIHDQLLQQGEMPPALEARILNALLFLHLFDNPAAPDAGRIIDRLMLLCKDQPPHQRVAIHANILSILSNNGDHARSRLFWELLRDPFSVELPPMLLLQAEWTRATYGNLIYQMADVRAGLDEMRRLCRSHTFSPSLLTLPEAVAIVHAISLDNYAVTVPADMMLSATSSDNFMGMICTHMLGLLSMGQGDYAQAILRFQPMVQGTQRMGFRTPHALATLDLAQAVFMVGEHEKAWAFMASVEQLADEQANPVLIARHGQLATILCLEENRRAAAIQWLERALAAMEQSGQVTLAGWGPGRAMRLVRLALEENIHVSFIQRMLSLWTHLRPTPEMQPLENWPWPVRLRTLGGLEIMVQGKPLT